MGCCQSCLGGDSSQSTERTALLAHTKNRAHHVHVGADQEFENGLISEVNAQGIYTVEDELPCLGGRTRKNWYLGRKHKFGGQVLVTVAPWSLRCARSETKKKSVPAINFLLTKLGKHPLLHPICEVRLAEKPGSEEFMTKLGKAVIIQPLVEEGSLRDYLHAVEPLTEWDEKYGTKGKKRMDGEEIAACGRSILEAILFLYECGFPPLGHVQTGNIFKTPRGYTLGGYENTLLGYLNSRDSSLHTLPYGNAIDLIMFGHAIYEMASAGRELTSVIPDDEDSCYRHVKDETVLRILKLIFSKTAEEDYQASLSELLEDEFFTNVPCQGGIASGYEFDITGREKNFLSEVREETEVPYTKVDKEKLVDTMNYYLRRRNYMCLNTEDAMTIGTRQGKLWGSVEKDYQRQLISATELSSDCPIKLTPGCVATIRKFFQSLRHPNLLTLEDFKYYDGEAVFLQPFLEQGSLRDQIYQTEPWSKWSHKASAVGHVLKREMIQLYSKQILMACHVLYCLGFYQLGHIQSGNIFVEGEHLRVGGFENMLLGYSTAGSDRFQQYKHYLDRIMFGHVVFEMGAGTTIDSAIPSDDDYDKIKDRAVAKFVKEIFEDVRECSSSGGRFSATVSTDWITELGRNDFVGGIGEPQLDMQCDDSALEDMEALLKKVKKKKPQRQKSIAQFGASVKAKVRKATMKKRSH